MTGAERYRQSQVSTNCSWRCLVVNPFEDESAAYMVLVNHEGQYSLWPAFHEQPEGWAAVGPTGGRQLCLHWIETNWTDIRPQSLSGKSVELKR
jgi:MbtH protein